MRWTPEDVTHFAYTAGFRVPDLTTAVAIAIVASGGDSTRQHVFGPPGCGRQVGLWAIDPERWPEVASYDLTNPQDNAAAAYALTVARSGFDWSPYWRTGAFRTYIPHAALHTARRPRPPTVNDPRR